MLLIRSTHHVLIIMIVLLKKFYFVAHDNNFRVQIIILRAFT